MNLDSLSIGPEQINPPTNGELSPSEKETFFADIRGYRRQLYRDLEEKGKRSLNRPGRPPVRAEAVLNHVEAAVIERFDSNQPEQSELSDEEMLDLCISSGASPDRPTMTSLRAVMCGARQSVSGPHAKAKRKLPGLLLRESFRVEDTLQETAYRLGWPEDDAALKAALNSLDGGLGHEELVVLVSPRAAKIDVHAGACGAISGHVSDAIDDYLTANKREVMEMTWPELSARLHPIVEKAADAAEKDLRRFQTKMIAMDKRPAATAGGTLAVELGLTIKQHQTLVEELSPPGYRASLRRSGGGRRSGGWKSQERYDRARLAKKRFRKLTKSIKK